MFHFKCKYMVLYKWNDMKFNNEMSYIFILMFKQNGLAVCRGF